MHSNNLTYEKIDTYLFSEIPWFSKYFFESWYNEGDLKEKYTVFWVLCDFLHYRYLDENMNIIWDSHELDLLINVLNRIYTNWDDKLKELICIGFIENLISDDSGKMWKLKIILKHENLINCMTELSKFWYKI